MNKIFRFAIAAIMVVGVTLMSVSHIVLAAPPLPGTLPPSPDKITTADGGPVCVGTACAFFNHFTIPGSGCAAVALNEVSGIGRWYGAPPGDTHFVADGIDIRVFFHGPTGCGSGDQVIYFQPPVKVCFSVTPGWDGVVRYWATRAYLESLGRSYSDLDESTGSWIALPTFIDTVDWPGTYCAWAYEPGALVAVGGFVSP